MAWYWWLLIGYIILMVLVCWHMYKNWYYYKNVMELLFREKEKVAKKILEAKDGKEKRKILKENIFKIV